jgi:hypothetical protein
LLCRKQAKRMMRESKVQIGNFGLSVCNSAVARRSGAEISPERESRKVQT